MKFQNINVNPKKVTCFFSYIVIGLVAFGAIGQYSKYFLGNSRLFGFVNLFELNGEANIPTWYNTKLLFMSFVLLFLITTLKKQVKDHYWLHWAGLSTVFLLLSVDEFVGIHEKFNRLRNLLKFDGIFYYNWVIIYGILVIGMVILYWKFLKDLPQKTRRLFLLAGVVYVGAAIGMELPQSYMVSSYGEQVIFVEISWQGWVVSILTIIEEFLEMMGCIIFIHALLTYIKSQWGSFSFSFSEEATIKTKVMTHIK